MDAELDMCRPAAKLYNVCSLATSRSKLHSYMIHGGESTSLCAGYKQKWFRLKGNLLFYFKVDELGGWEVREKPNQPLLHCSTTAASAFVCLAQTCICKLVCRSMRPIHV